MNIERSTLRPKYFNCYDNAYLFEIVSALIQNLFLCWCNRRYVTTDWPTMCRYIFV